MVEDIKIELKKRIILVIDVYIWRPCYNGIDIRVIINGFCGMNYDWQSSSSFRINLAAVLFLVPVMPRMTKLLMEGLITSECKIW